MNDAFRKKVDEKFLGIHNKEQSEKADIEQRRHMLNLEKAELHTKRAEFEREKEEWEIYLKSKNYCYKLSTSSRCIIILNANTHISPAETERSGGERMKPMGALVAWAVNLKITSMLSFFNFQ